MILHFDVYCRDREFRGILRLCPFRIINHNEPYDLDMIEHDLFCEYSDDDWECLLVRLHSITF